MDYTIDETKLLNMVEDFLNSQKELIDSNICYFKVFPADSDDDNPQPGILIYVEHRRVNALIYSMPKIKMGITKRLKGFFNIDEDFFWIHFTSTHC